MIWAVVVLAVLAVVQSWPLPLYVATHFTGDPRGDTGVYVWNLWVFHHEIVDRASVPWITSEVLALAGSADLRLHNYTVFSNLLALPLVDWLGIVQTFNAIYLVNCFLAGLGAFLLARRYTGRMAESLLAGWLFAWSPFLVARSLGHFSLASAAALPFFLLALDRTWERRRLRDAIALGLTFAWAAFSDPYYAVYCVLLAIAYAGHRLVRARVERRPADAWRGARLALDAALGVLALAIVGVHLLSDGVFEAGALRITMRTLYTPMLVVTVLALARVLLSWRIRVAVARPPAPARLARAAIAAGTVAGILLAPLLYGLIGQMLGEHGPTPPVLWRSSAAGMDVAALLLPNPQHPLAPDAWAAWLDAKPGGIAENTASLSWVGLWLIVAAWRLTGFRPDRFWTIVAVGFGVLALGPFVQVAGINTFVPTPWALLRYVPIIGDARMPTRFTVLVVLALSIVAAQALTAIVRRYPGQRRAWLAAAAAAVLLELIPAPRTLFDASVPEIYQRVAADPRPVRVLTLPTGIRDGLSSVGDFDPATQYHQTFHEKGLIGGYLSRVPLRDRSALRQAPVLAALLDLSEGHPLSEVERLRAYEGVADFLATTQLGYVVMHRARTPAELRDFAVELFSLTFVEHADGYDLYVPGGTRPQSRLAPSRRSVYE